jgi:hypothetical protein
MGEIVMTAFFSPARAGRIIWGAGPVLLLPTATDNALLDVYAGVWLFTANDSFYPGDLVRSQAPLASFQGHLGYNVTPQLWAAFDATYYAGGRTTIHGVANGDLQSNSRVGATLVLPVGSGTPSSSR